MAEMDSDSLRSWLLSARLLSLSNLPNVGKAANANMLVLQIPPVVDVQEILAALEQVRSEYQGKVEARERAGFFYAWFDEMSGTIRCSFCEVRRFHDLPFGGSFRRAGSLAEIAASLMSNYAHGIPMQELVGVEWSDPDDSAEVELLVFADALGPL